MYLFQISYSRGCCINMATGGPTPALPAASEDATTPSKTSPEEPWCTVACEAYKRRVWDNQRKHFQQDQLTDVMLAAGGQSIPCHKLLLSSASQFFHDKFVVHPETLEHSILNIEGIDFDTLTAIVSFVHV